MFTQKLVKTVKLILVINLIYFDTVNTDTVMITIITTMIMLFCLTSSQQSVPLSFLIVHGDSTCREDGDQ